MLFRLTGPLYLPRLNISLLLLVLKASLCVAWRGVYVLRGSDVYLTVGRRSPAAFQQNFGYLCFKLGSMLRWISVGGGGLSLTPSLLFARFTTQKNIKISLVSTEAVVFICSCLNQGLGTAGSVQLHFWFTFTPAEWGSESVLAGLDRFTVFLT